jgi:type 1 fimbriae regulatory protein FimB/type 1 fimbriae regulatory protein FimE
VKAAKRRGRYGHRDTAIMLCYRHGLRVSELCGLQWTQFNLDRGTFEVRYTKMSPDRFRGWVDDIGVSV